MCFYLCTIAKSYFTDVTIILVLKINSISKIACYFNFCLILKAYFTGPFDKNTNTGMTIRIDDSTVIKSNTGTRGGT